MNKEFSMRNMLRPPQIIVVCGPSGAGKGIVLAKLLETGECELIESLTSREPRTSDNQIAENEYKYVKDDTLDRLDRQGKLIWLEGEYGNRYATKISSIDRFKYSRHKIGVMSITIRTARILMKRMNGINILYLFIKVGDQNIRRQRMISRGDNPEDIERRISKDSDIETRAIFSEVPFVFIDNSGTITELEESLWEVLREL